MSKTTEQEKELFNQALDIESADVRAVFLENSCGADTEKLRRIERLISAYEAAGGFIPTKQDDPAFLATSLVSEGPGTRIGRYKLLQQIGEGGMGVVYMAEQEEPIRRRVALKIIKVGMDTRQVIARFEAERQALALMDHPNIARVLDGGATAGGRPYFVMELIQGVPITEFCNKAQLSVRQRLDLFVQVCQATQSAHQKGIIHRDIKPSNVLVTLHDGVPVPKIIDFGIAKATNQRLTERTLFTNFGSMIGTPAYMSPEQAELSGLDVDTRTDVYALGVLLYALLTGTTPFTERRLRSLAYGEMQRVICEEEPERPSSRLSTLDDEGTTTLTRSCNESVATLSRHIQGDLDWIVMKCLEKDRQRRYETANALAMDVTRHLTNEPVTACPPNRLYKLRKALRRNRVAFSAAASVAAALLLGITTSVWQAAKAKHAQESEAEANARLRRQVFETERARLSEREHRLRSEATLHHVHVQKAEQFFNESESLAGLDSLARVLRLDPSNRLASTRFVSALLNRPFPRRQTKPMRHEHPINEADFSPDGLRVVTASSDGTARVWDAVTGDPITPPLKYDAWVLFARFLPDGQRVLTRSKDGAYRVWDARTGEPLTQSFQDATSDRIGTTDHRFHGFSPDGQRLLTRSGKSAIIWDTATGKPRTDPLRHAGWVIAAGFSRDGMRVVTGSTDKTARIWNALTGAAMTGPLQHSAEVRSVEFSEDGSRVLTVAAADSTHHKVRCWDAEHGNPMTEELSVDKEVASARFSQDGKRIVVVFSDQTIRCWDAYSSKVSEEQPTVEDLKVGWIYSSDKQSVVTNSADGTLRVVNANTHQVLAELPAELHRYGGRRFGGPQLVTKLAPDFRRAIIGLDSNTMEVWDLSVATPLSEPLRHDTAVVHAAFSVDGRRILTKTKNGSVMVWDADRSQPLTEYLGRQAGVRSTGLSRDGQRYVTLLDDGTARVWDALSGRALTKPLGKHLTGAFLNRDGTRILTTERDGHSFSARMWDVSSGLASTERLNVIDALPFQTSGPVLNWDQLDFRSFMKTGEYHFEGGGAYAKQLSPDGLRVLFTGRDHAHVRDAKTGEPLGPPLRHYAHVADAQISPDGFQIVTASADKSARVWGSVTGQPLTEPIRHEAAVTSARFSPDGDRIVTVSADRTARVWDARTGHPLSERFLHQAEVTSAEFSPDGNRIVTASTDGIVRVWDTPAVFEPLPKWFLDWAETRVGRRLGRNELDAFIPVDEVRRQEALVEGLQDDGVLTRFAKWMQADVATRQISPLSEVRRSDYIDRRLKEERIDTSREAVDLAPTNWLAITRLGIVLLSEDSKQNPGRIEEARLLIDHALRIAPSNAEPWRVLGMIESQSGRVAEALMSINKALDLQPQNGETWETKGDILQRSQRWEEAREAYTKALVWLPQTNKMVDSIRVRTLLSRSSVLKHLEQSRAASEDLMLARNIPSRQPQTEPNMVDLSFYYNAGLKEAWLPQQPYNTLGQLPTGVQKLGGVWFDVRGILQLVSETDLPSRYPTEIKGIHLARKATRVHFLHALAKHIERGTIAAKYVVHYANGAVRERVLVEGEDLLDLNSPEAGLARSLAWSGLSTKLDSSDQFSPQGQWYHPEVRLYRTTWENPLPESQIIELDFVAARPSLLPFLIAVTLE